MGIIKQARELIKEEMANPSAFHTSVLESIIAEVGWEESIEEAKRLIEEFKLEKLKRFFD